MIIVSACCPLSSSSKLCCRGALADQQRARFLGVHRKFSSILIFQPCCHLIAGHRSGAVRSLTYSRLACRFLSATQEFRGGRLESKALESVDLGQSEDERSRALQDGATKKRRRRRVYLLDVHPLCYDGSKPSAAAFLEWIRLLFDQVAYQDPIIAVMDGEMGNMQRRCLLPSYKKFRNRYRPLQEAELMGNRSQGVDLRQAFPCIRAFFHLCKVPVVKLEAAEADDVIASLTYLATTKGLDVVIASPDMDFRQLLADNVQLVLPIQKLLKWSFYTLQLYMSQHQCHPSMELGIRCLLGDVTDSVPGLTELAPGFGRKTALKLMKKHGSLQALLEATTKRTVGKPYIQNALTEYASVLYKNYQVLSLRRDIKVPFEEKWFEDRDASNDAVALASLKHEFCRLQQSSYLPYHR